MGVLELFRKAFSATPRTVSRVLVCAVGDGHEKELAEDAAIYRAYFPEAVVERYLTAALFMAALAQRYDVVHVLAAVDAQGRVAGSENTGTAFIGHAASYGTKLLWFAASNAADGYVTDFKTGKDRINLVMTINRQGDDLPDFVNDLFSRMRRGMKMPVAWNDMAPQIPGRPQPNVPEQIYAAGFGAATFF